MVVRSMVLDDHLARVNYKLTGEGRSGREQLLVITTVNK